MNAEVSKRNASATAALLGPVVKKSLFAFQFLPPLAEQSFHRVAPGGATGDFVQSDFKFLVRDSRRGGYEWGCHSGNKLIDLVAQFQQVGPREVFNLVNQTLSGFRHSRNIAETAC